MKRRLLASLSVLFILSSINAQVFAADSSLQEITFNEYYSAIQDRFESYGIRWEGVSTNNLYPDYVYTQEDLWCRTTTLSREIILQMQRSQLISPVK